MLNLLFCRTHYCRASTHTGHYKVISNVLPSCHLEKKSGAMLGTLNSGGFGLKSFVPALSKQWTKEAFVSDSICRMSCKSPPGSKGRNSLAQYFTLAHCAYSAQKFIFLKPIWKQVQQGSTKALFATRENVTGSQQGIANSPYTLLLFHRHHLKP